MSPCDGRAPVPDSLKRIVDARTGSPDRFGYEWNEYAELRPEYEEQFRRWTAPLSPEDWRGRSFLDVGCGMGRNSYWPLSYGAAAGVAIDVDRRSLEAARRTLRHFANSGVIAASAYQLPFDNRFDVVFSIGVIHHLESPERALVEMVRAARPGGRVLIWVYGRESNEWIGRYVDPLRTWVLSRLPVGLLHHVSLYPAVALWIALRGGVGRTAYCDLLRRFAFRHLRAIVFDQLLPRIAHYWPEATVQKLMVDAGLDDVQLVHVNGMSWTAIGRKPASPRLRLRQAAGPDSSPPRDAT